MRSTCVMTIRRQQYRLSPSWSIASLPTVSLDMQRVVRLQPDVPIVDAIVDKLEISLPKVARDLVVG